MASDTSAVSVASVANGLLSHGGGEGVCVSGAGGSAESRKSVLAGWPARTGWPDQAEQSVWSGRTEPAVSILGTRSGEGAGRGTPPLNQWLDQ